MSHGNSTKNIKVWLKFSVFRDIFKMAGDEEEKKNEEEKDMELDLMAEAELLRLTR
jgi:hypothetical protein